MMARRHLATDDQWPMILTLCPYDPIRHLAADEQWPIILTLCPYDPIRHLAADDQWLRKSRIVYKLQTDGDSLSNGTTPRFLFLRDFGGKWHMGVLSDVLTGNLARLQSAIMSSSNSKTVSTMCPQAMVPAYCTAPFPFSPTPPSPPDISCFLTTFPLI